MTPAERIARVLVEIRGVEGQSITKWEGTWLRDNQYRVYLTERQEATLSKIEAKVFPDPDDEEDDDDGTEEGVQRTDDRFQRGRGV